MKTAASWINEYTLPPRFSLNDQGYAIPSARTISAVQRHHISQVVIKFFEGFPVKYVVLSIA